MTRRTILLAEDSALQATSLSDLLEEGGYRVLSTADGEAAWEVLESGGVDLVLADVRMPILDGYRLCERLREHDSLASLPFLLMSVYDEAENALEGLRCGADLFLAKPLDPDVLLSRLERLLETPRPTRGEGVRRSCTTWFEDRAVEVASDPDRAVDYLACTLEDMTRARKAAERERRLRDEALKARDFLQAVLDAFPSEVAVLDGKGEVLEHNRTWSGPGRLALREGGLRAVVAGARDRHEHEYAEEREGETRWIQEQAIRFPGSEPAQLLVLRRDVTERKAMDERMRLAQKMEAVGSLTAGIAHEINNPLTWVLGHLEELRRDPAGPETPEHLEGLSEGLGRIQEIVSKLGVFARTEEVGERDAVDLAAVVEGAARLMANELRFRARLELELPEELPRVRGLSTELGQVVLGLLVNAARAIPEGDVEGNRVRVRLEARGDQVHLEVEDSGEGIPAEILPRIFDPFFTTRAPGEGTGLGLSVIDEVVRGLGGRIDVSSEVGRGSRFTVVLPVAAAGAETRGPVAETPQPAGGELRRGRILVVDDEPRLADMVQRMLHKEHDVLLAGSGSRAREILKRDRGFDMILCDMMMPDLTGMELLDWLREHHPETAAKLVFMTGGTLTEKARRYREEAGGTVLEKPFRSAELRALVRRRLSVGGDGA